MVQLVNPAQNALNAFGQVKDIQYRQDQEEFLAQKREDYKVDREFTLEERERVAKQREAKKTFEAIKFGMMDENGNLKDDIGNELVNHEALSGVFLQQASEITGRDDIEELRVIQADSDMAEQYPDLQPGSIVPFGRTKDGKVIPLVDKETGEAFTMDSDEFAGVVTSAAAAAGQYDVANSIVAGRRDNRQRQSIADLGRSFKGQQADLGEVDLTPQSQQEAAQAAPGGDGALAPVGASPDNDFTVEELDEEIDDLEEELGAMGKVEELDRVQEPHRTVNDTLRGTQLNAAAGERQSQRAQERSRLEARLNTAKEQRSRLQTGAQVASEEQQLRQSADTKAQEVRKIRAGLMQAKNNGERFNARVSMQNEQIERIADLAETGAIDAGSMYDMIDSIKNPDLNTETFETDTHLITLDQLGNEINRVPINPGGSGLSPKEERALANTQLRQAREMSDRAVENLGLEKGTEDAREVTRLTSNTARLLDPSVINVDGVVLQAYSDLDQYIDDNDGIFRSIGAALGWADPVPSRENQMDLMPAILARAMMPRGADSPTKSAIGQSKDQVDLVRKSLDDAGIRGAAVERTAFSALAALAQQGADEAMINRASAGLANLARSNPEFLIQASSTPNGALALAKHISSQ